MLVRFVGPNTKLETMEIEDPNYLEVLRRSRIIARLYVLPACVEIWEDSDLVLWLLWRVLDANAIVDELSLQRVGFPSSSEKLTPTKVDQFLPKLLYKLLQCGPGEWFFVLYSKSRPVEYGLWKTLSERRSNDSSQI